MTSYRDYVLCILNILKQLIFLTSKFMYILTPWKWKRIIFIFLQCSHLTSQWTCFYSLNHFKWNDIEEENMKFMEESSKLNDFIEIRLYLQNILGKTNNNLLRHQILSHIVACMYLFLHSMYKKYLQTLYLLRHRI